MKLRTDLIQNLHKMVVPVCTIQLELNWYNNDDSDDDNSNENDPHLSTQSPIHQPFTYLLK